MNRFALLLATIAVAAAASDGMPFPPPLPPSVRAVRRSAAAGGPRARSARASRPVLSGADRQASPSHR